MGMSHNDLLHERLDANDDEIFDLKETIEELREEIALLKNKLSYSEKLEAAAEAARSE